MFNCAVNLNCDNTLKTFAVPAIRKRLVAVMIGGEATDENDDAAAVMTGLKIGTKKPAYTDQFLYRYIYAYLF